jgi:AcrR family transcriptional regulator
MSSESKWHFAFGNDACNGEKKTKSHPRTYPAHRERQRKRILDAAEKLFVERGIDRVTMGELTAASGLQSSTMYEYFSKKDDIVWAIAGNIIGKVSARSLDADASTTSALNKITLPFLNTWRKNSPISQPRSASWRSSTPYIPMTGPLNAC